MKERLIKSSRSGNIRNVKYLIKEGVDVNTADNNGDTPLHLVSFRGYLDIVKLLIEKGANVNTADNYGNTPLHRASTLDIARLLIENGANVDAANNAGERPLNKVLTSIFFVKSYLDVAKLLIEKGANVNATDNDGDTPLHVVSFKGYLNIAKLLIENGADPNIQNIFRKTANDIARKKGYVKGSETLIDWFIEQNLYLNNFLTFLNKEELTDINIRENLVHQIIVEMRVGNAYQNVYLNTLSQEEVKEFLKWIYTGLSNDYSTVKRICNEIGINFEEKNGAVNFQKDIQTLYDNRDETGDFTIIVGAEKDNEGNFIENTGTNIEVHKTILNVHSRLFREMFLHAQPEPGRENQVHDYSGYSVEDIEKIIKFMYTGQEPEEMPENWEEMLEYYQIIQ